MCRKINGIYDETDTYKYIMRIKKEKYTRKFIPPNEKFQKSLDFFRGGKIFLIKILRRNQKYEKKTFAALLMAGALAVVPCGNLFSMVATASTNNTVSSGSSSTGGSSSGSSSVGTSDYEAKFENEIAAAEAGSTVTISRDQGINTLSNAFMKTLLERGDVALVFEYSYAGVDYTIEIPAGEALDNDIPWYGPLYLYSIYGKNTNTEGGSEYIVQANDTMSKIAKKNGVTLAELKEMNPQVKNINRIRVGQVLKVK